MRHAASRHARLCALVRLTSGALTLALALGLGLIAPPPVEAAATATSFSPATVALPSTGSTATITVATVGVDATVNGVQLNIQHSNSFTVTAPTCTGIFAGGTVLGPTPVTGGTVIGCALIPGPVSGPTGNVMTFALTRTGAGDGTITLGTAAPFGTQFSAAGTFVSAGTLGSLQVTGTAATVTPTSVTTVTPTTVTAATVTPTTVTPVVPEWSVWWLFGSGLLCLGWLAYRSQGRRR